tara:strand:- start:60 stop:494 length:435 start_codon:yes stop_codon:yes gene_type:complete
MRLWRALLSALVVTLPAATNAAAASGDTVRDALLRGEFDAAAQASSAADGPAAGGGEADYYRGLALFALRDYPAAVASLVGVAERNGERPIGLRAAVVATVALSRNGDRDNACRYAGIVLPLTDTMAPIWRAWVEEAQRSSGCE